MRLGPHFRELPSFPLPQRSSAADTNAWVEPLPHSSDQYQSFWLGNQLPGSFMITPAKSYRLAISSQYDTQPVRPGGIFSTQLGQLQSASLIARMKDAWAAARGRY